MNKQTNKQTVTNKRVKLSCIDYLQLNTQMKKLCTEDNTDTPHILLSTYHCINTLQTRLPTENSVAVLVKIQLSMR